MSGGNRASNDRLRPSDGCANASRVACNAWRNMPQRWRAAIQCIGDQWMALRSQMDADLMGSPGMKPTAYGGESAIAGQSLDIGPRLAPASHHRHPDPRFRVARNRRFDAHAQPAGSYAVNQRQVFAPRLRARRWRGSARSPPAKSCRPPSAPTCPCRADARCRHAAASQPARWWASKAFSKVPDQLPAAG